jgi:hypothetical protein
LIVDQTPSHSSKPWACSYDQVLQTTSLQLFARVHRPLSDHYYSTTLTTFVHQICNKNTIDIHTLTSSDSATTVDTCPHWDPANRKQFSGEGGEPGLGGCARGGVKVWAGVCVGCDCEP